MTNAPLRLDLPSNFIFTSRGYNCQVKIYFFPENGGECRIFRGNPMTEQQKAESYITTVFILDLDAGYMSGKKYTRSMVEEIVKGYLSKVNEKIAAESAAYMERIAPSAFNRVYVDERRHSKAVRKTISTMKKKSTTKVTK